MTRPPALIATDPPRLTWPVIAEETLDHTAKKPLTQERA
ncbi:hypothetical protein SCH4B_3580 [Ruegeria sp. TrichCH4B]|nr:hypothetical protein SCH4B_3580 [Ruegeria sp. TrichCH4B]